MFQLCMAPFTPDDDHVDVQNIEGAIEDQLSHVSASCRDTLFDCLSTSPVVQVRVWMWGLTTSIGPRSAAAKLTIDELSKRKWLRHVDFISVSSKLEHHPNHAHMRRLLYRSLVWKLAAFFLADWIEHAHALTPVPTAATTEDDDVRQRQKVRV